MTQCQFSKGITVTFSALTYLVYFSLLVSPFTLGFLVYKNTESGGYASLSLLTASLTSFLVVLIAFGTKYLFFRKDTSNSTVFYMSRFLSVVFSMALLESIAILGYIFARRSSMQSYLPFGTATILLMLFYGYKVFSQKRKFVATLTSAERIDS